MEEKQTEFSPETDFILIRWFRPSDQDAVTELVEAGLKSYGVRKWNNKVGALKTPLGYTTKEALRACFDAYVEHVKTQDLGSISTHYHRAERAGLLVAELFIYDPSQGFPSITDEQLQQWDDNVTALPGYRSQIVGSVGFQPCRVGDKAYYKALIEAYVAFLEDQHVKRMREPLKCPQNEQGEDCSAQLQGLQSTNANVSPKVETQMPEKECENDISAEEELRKQFTEIAVQWAEKECELRRMSISSACRGLGIGRMLVAALVQSARLDGFTRLHLTTGSRMPAAYEFYHSLGFVDIGHVYFGCHNPKNVHSTEDGLGEEHWDQLLDTNFEVPPEDGYSKHPEMFFDESHYAVRLHPWSGTPLKVFPSAAALRKGTGVPGQVSIGVPYRAQELLRAVNKKQNMSADASDIMSPVSPLSLSSSISEMLTLSEAKSSSCDEGGRIDDAVSTIASQVSISPASSSGHPDCGCLQSSSRQQDSVPTDEPPELVCYDLVKSEMYQAAVVKTKPKPYRVAKETILRYPRVNFHPNSPVLRIPHSVPAPPQVFGTLRLHKNEYQEKFEWEP